MNFYSNENSKESEEIKYHKDKFIKQVQSENRIPMENYFYYGNLVLLIYVWKYIKKFEKISRFEKTYYENISLVKNVGSVFEYFIPNSQFVKEKIKQASEFENMTVLNMAIINNSKSTNIIFQYISFASNGKINYGKLFYELFIIQSENRFNQYATYGLLIVCFISIFFLHEKGCFKLSSLLFILLLNVFTSNLRVIFICLGGISSVDLDEGEPTKIFIWMLLGCVAGILLTIKANNYFIPRILLDNFDLMGECYSRARRILNIGRSCTIEELELKTVASLNNVFEDNYMVRVSNKSMILGAYAIIRDNIRKY